jgi:hypothetical protein
MLNQNVPGSIKGQGANLMLPARGNPFGAEGDPPAQAGPLMPVDEVPLGLVAFAAAEQSAAPDNIAPPSEAPMSEMPVPEAVPSSNAAPAVGAAPAPEAPAVAPEATPVVADVAPIVAPEVAPVVADVAPPVTAPEAAPTTSADLGTTITTVVTIPPAPEAEAPAGVADSIPAAAVNTTAVVTASASAGGGDQPGARASAALQISENVGPSLPTFVPPAELRGEDDLVNMFVTDDRLSTLWLEIESLERDIASTPDVSLKMAHEMADRLTTARNMMMNSREKYEDANRQVVEVKYLLSRVHRSGWTQQTRPILGYLVISLLLLVGGFLLRTARLGPILEAKGTITENWVWSILFGGVGGVTGALYGLWKHVASDQDYDPQFALWYYTNPVMGLVLGGLVFFLLLAGLAISSGGNAITPSSYTAWVLAFAVGFQQTLAFSLLNTVLKGLMPPGEKGASTSPAITAKAPTDSKKP